MNTVPAPRLLIAAAAFAFGLPTLTAFGWAPAPLVLNDLLALLGWGVFLALVRPGPLVWRAPLPLLAALSFLLLAGTWSVGHFNLPLSRALCIVGMLLAAAVMVGAGASQGANRASGAAESILAAACWGLVAAGMTNAVVALVQVLAPSVPDNFVIAQSHMPGRAVGNLRQPNLAASILVWAGVAVLALETMGRLPKLVARVLLGVLVVSVLFTGSRSGLLMLAVLGLLAFGLWASGQARGQRIPWMMALKGVGAVLAGTVLAALAAHMFFDARLGIMARDLESQMASLSFRLAIWADMLRLIAANGWLGVGLGNTNFAWALTPGMYRYFDRTLDNAHSLPLDLAVQLGVPLALLVLGLLGWSLWRAARRARGADGRLDPCVWVPLAMVVVMGVHSLLEYPLWYAFYLLPFAWFWGFALGASAPRPVGSARASAAAAAAPETPSGWPLGALRVAGVLMAVGAVLAAADFQRVRGLVDEDASATPLVQRLAEARRSVLYAHYAAPIQAASIGMIDAAASGQGGPRATPAERLAVMEEAARVIVDVPLLIAWAQEWERAGDPDRASYLAGRVREFSGPLVTQYLAPCQAALALPYSARPLQCVPPGRTLDWESFIRRK